jgi:hypothetical protein
LTTFSVFDAVLIGALGMATMLFVLVAAAYFAFKVIPLFTSIEKSLKGLDTVLKQDRETLVGIRQELGMMRQMTQAMTPNSGTETPWTPPTPTPGGEAAEAPATAAYPAPVFDRFPVVEDAKPEDTDPAGLTQTDADLVAMEQLEALRQRGIEVEDSDAEHEGVEADAE